MKKIQLFCILSFSLLIFTGCSSQASWIYDFVKYEDVFYKVTEEKVENVGEKLGEVTSYLDMEGEAPNLSSNVYDVGTEIYSIEGIDVKEAIAVKVKDGEFIKLIAQSK